MKAIDQIYRTPPPPLNTPEDVALVAADTTRRFPDQPELLAMLGIEVEHDHDPGGCTCGCPVSGCLACGEEAAS